AAALERRLPRVRARTLAGGLALVCALAGPALAVEPTVPSPAAVKADAAVPVETAAVDPVAADSATQSPPDVPGIVLPAGTRSGLDIYRNFRAGLADPSCPADASPRWRRQFAHAPGQFVAAGSDVLPLFGYVVDRLRELHLPTEYALIPFVESGYRPGARSPHGPAGLWQFIALTARNHKVAIGPGYDGRLSP